MSSANQPPLAAPPAPTIVDVLLLTPQQAAMLCQVSTDKIYEWSYLPGFPVVAGAHQLRIHARLFDAWLERRAMEGRPRKELEEAEEQAEEVAS